jgi:6-phosphogluconolactonase
MRFSRRKFLYSTAAAPLLNPLLSGFEKKKPLPPPIEIPLYIGTYTDGSSKGILTSRFNTQTGLISPPELAATTPSPSFLAVHPSGKFVYAVNEVGNWNGQRTGSVSAYAVQGGGQLALLNQVSSMGQGPCHVSIDSTGHSVLVANYSSGTIASYLAGADGKLSEAVSFFRYSGYGPNKARQEGPHAHSNTITVDNRFVISCDLGTDQLHLFDLNPATAVLNPHTPQVVHTLPGSGPRHFAIHTDQKWAFVNNEMGNSVTAYQWERYKGELTEIQTISTLPASFTGQNTTAEIRVHPHNSHVYVSNRGHDSVAVFAVGDHGELTLVEIVPTGGKGPRSITFDPTGRFLVVANQQSNNITVFGVSPKATLRQVEATISCGSPVCVTFGA